MKSFSEFLIFLTCLVFHTALFSVEVPNPDAGIDALSLDNEKIVLIYNDSHAERCPLTVALSYDHGNSWVPLFNLENESGEFPSTTLDSQGFVHVTYAYTPSGKTQRRIKHVVMDLKKAEQ